MHEFIQANAGPAKAKEEGLMHRIIQGDVRQTLSTINPKSVDCAVTSPPYWMLRKYLKDGHPLAHLEIGQEKTPQQYVEVIVGVLRLVRDALADHGTCWLNVGDTYVGGGRGTSDHHVEKMGVKTASAQSLGRMVYNDIDDGNLCLIPQRLAIALQDDGWLVRSYIIWHKPAAMPCSVKGWAWRRCQVKKKSSERVPAGYRSAEMSSNPHCAAIGPRKQREAFAANGGSAQNWDDCPGCKKCKPNGGYVLRKGSWRPTNSYEPILMLAKTDSYFSDGEPVKTKPAEATVSRDKYTRVLDDEDEQFAVRHDHETICDGANLRDVWRIASEPLKDAHYAAFPTELVRKCLQSGTSERGYCSACGKPWVRVVESKNVPHPRPGRSGRDEVDTNGGAQADGDIGWSETKTVDWRPSCVCGAEVRPGLVLDPFSGSGRTAMASRWLGLDFVGCELNPEYVEMSERILCNDSPLFS